MVVSGSLGGAGAVVLTDSTASLTCSGRFEGPEIGLLYSLCALTVADPAVSIIASVPAGGFDGTAESVEVTNADGSCKTVVRRDAEGPPQRHRTVASESIPSRNLHMVAAL